MTPERAKELLPVITAFAEGKKIECRSKGGAWWIASEPAWCDVTEYRIAPEPPAPRYRVRTIEEWRERFIRERIVLEGRGGLCLVHAIRSHVVCVSNHGDCSPQEMFDGFREADGSPCGVKIED